MTSLRQVKRALTFLSPTNRLHGRVRRSENNGKRTNMTDLKSNVKAFADKADDICRRTAESLESAADSARTAGNQGADKIHGLTDQAGKKLETTATFVRNARVRNAFGRDR